MDRASRHPHQSTGPSQSGLALVLTAVVGFLTMAMFLSAIRAVDDATRGERLQVLRQHRSDGVSAALADGVALLRTGEPPIDPYSCVETLFDAASNQYDCKVTFTNTGSLQYDVSADLATASEMTTLPLMPTTF